MPVGLNVIYSEQSSECDSEFTLDSEVGEMGKCQPKHIRILNTQYYGSRILQRFPRTTNTLLRSEFNMQRICSSQPCSNPIGSASSLQPRQAAAPTSRLMHSQPSILMSTSYTSILQLGTMHGHRKNDLVIQLHCQRPPDRYTYIKSKVYVRVLCLYRNQLYLNTRASDVDVYLAVH